MKYNVTFTLNSTFEDKSGPYVFEETVEAENELIAVALAAILSHLHPDDNFLGVAVEEVLALTPEEQKAVDLLKQLAGDWPKSLWLYAARGQLHVVKKFEGERVVDRGGDADEGFVVETLEILSDGAIRAGNK